MEKEIALPELQNQPHIYSHMHVQMFLTFELCHTKCLLK